MFKKILYPHQEIGASRGNFLSKEKKQKIAETVREHMDKNRPQPEDFKNIPGMSTEMIDMDIRKVVRLEEEWKKESDESRLELKQISDIAEFIIYKNLETWIDHKAVVLLSSKPDDYLRGIDLILESESEEGKGFDHLGVGIDIALTSVHGEGIGFELKKQKMRERLLAGELTEARYVSGGSYEGIIPDLPYVLLSVDKSHIDTLIPFAEKQIATEFEKNYILKYIIAYQIILQLHAYHDVSKKRGLEKSAHEYAIANNFFYDVVDSLYKEILDNPELAKKVVNDPGVKQINDFCEDLESLT